MSPDVRCNLDNARSRIRSEDTYLARPSYARSRRRQAYRRFFLAVIRLAKTREATVFRAEEHKAAIRRYMEAMGYTQTTDSIIEGHLADMVFLPPAGQASPPEVWVEAKATRLRLRDPDFVREVRAYLREWLHRRKEARFDLRIFVEALRSPVKWELVFGSALDPEDVVEWLRTPLEPEEEDDLTSPETRMEDVLSFLVETQVIEASADDLREAAEAKARVGMAAAEVRRKAQERLLAMEERSHAILRRSTIVGNLLPLRPPREYVVLRTKERSREVMHALLKGTPHAPFSTLSRSRILTFATSDVEADFAPLGVEVEETLTLERAKALDASALIALLNGGIRRVMARRGVGQHEGSFFLLAKQEVEAGEPRTIPTLTGEMVVAKPYYTSGEERRDPQEAPNYVYHEGFIAMCRERWGGFFVQMTLHRVYTTDGSNVIEGEAASRIDAHFRTPEWNRSDSQLRRLVNLARYLFPPARGSLDGPRNEPTWMHELQVERFMSLPTNWSPENVELDQGLLSHFPEEEDADSS